MQFRLDIIHHVQQALYNSFLVGHNILVNLHQLLLLLYLHLLLEIVFRAIIVLLFLIELMFSILSIGFYLLPCFLLGFFQPLVLLCGEGGGEGRRGEVGEQILNKEISRPLALTYSGAQEHNREKMTVHEASNL